MLIAALVLLPMAGAVLCALLGRRSERSRDLCAAAVTLVELGLSLLLPSRLPAWRVGGILSGGLSFAVDGFRAVYGIVTALMWAGTSLFALEYFRDERENLGRYWFFVLVTLGATEGVMLSADLMTTFVFFELLSFTSFTWVIHEETADAVRAGYTYLFIAVIGGLVLFMGLLLMRSGAGTLAYAELADAAAAGDRGRVLAGGFCILLGFGAKAGMFPVHVWLPKAHPVAPSPASALLSGILTKVGIYGILMTTLNAFAGDGIFGLTVLLLGLVTMALGALLALFSVNLKRTLACSSMSQVGFILTGIGMAALLGAAGAEEGVSTALCGTVLHMLNHSLIKLTLFMAAGVVVMDLHALDLNAIRGWGRNKTFLKLAFALGALGISGVPLFNGYLSKTLLHEGIVEGIAECAWIAPLLRVSEWVFLVSGGLTFAYMLKLFICLFVERNASAKKQKAWDGDRHCMDALSTAVIVLSSLLMAVLGQPALVKPLASYMTGSQHIMHFEAFSFECLKGGLISLAIGGCVYLLIVRRLLCRKGVYIDLWPRALDLEELVYRPLLVRGLPAVFGALASVFGENKLLTPVAKRTPAALGALASVFGENRLLAPLSKAAVWLAGLLSKLLSDSLDAVIVLMRATVLRERAVRKGRTRAGRLAELGEEVRESTRPILQNFTFAMMMTCIGLLLTLGVLLWHVLR